MKPWAKNPVLLFLGIAVVVCLAARAQLASLSAPPAPVVDSFVQITAEAQGLERVLPADLPRNGTFWLVMPGGGRAPLPCPPYDLTLPVYQIADGQFLVDDTGGQVFMNARQAATMSAAAALDSQASALADFIASIQEAQISRDLARSMGMDFPFPSGGGDGGSYTNNYGSYQIDTNLLWLEITNVSGGSSYLNLHSGTNQFSTNQVFAIWTTTNLLTAWQVERELWPTNSEVMPFTLPTLNREDLFVRAEDWTGKDSNGDGVPDWWAWKYFGNVSEPATNDYDGDGQNNWQEYTNHTDPNNITFTIRLGNQNFNTTNATGSFLVYAGTPSYTAVLPASTNLAAAVWQPYDGSIHFNLGPTNGEYQVWFGLKGRAADSQPTWIGTKVTLNRQTPQITLTSPTNGVVAQPYLQIKGCSALPLESVTYDLNGETNLSGLIIRHTLDTNTSSYTTDYFQCYDLLLNEGTNTISLHATDPAGNTLTTNLTVVLDYDTATNPVIKLTWPRDGLELCGNNFTLRGWTEDAAATATATVISTNGGTNTVTGIVSRDGNLWVQGLLLNNGTNIVTLTVTNTAGFSNATNFTVVKNDMTLALTSVDGDLWLPTVSVNGVISVTNAPVWVNGVQGTNNGDGTWLADNIPVSPGGVASFDISTIPPGSEDPAANANLVKVDEMVLESAKWNNGDYMFSGPQLNEGNRHRVKGSFSWGKGGTINEVYEALDTNQMVVSTGWIDSTLSSNGSFIVVSYSYGYSGNFSYSYTNWGGAYTIAHEIGAMSLQSTNGLPQGWDKDSQVKFMFHTGGFGVAGSEVLIEAMGAANEIYPVPTNVPPVEIAAGQIGQLDTNAVAYGKIKDGASVAVTSKTPRPLYGTYPGAGGYRLKTWTHCPALTDTNRARLNIGVGEEVDLSGMPGNTKWNTGGGGLSDTKGSRVTFTAPSNAPAGGVSATVTATIKTASWAVPYKIFPPSGIDHAKITGTNSYPLGKAGAGMTNSIWIAPTSVSFYRVNVLEIGEDATNVWGFYSQWTPQQLHHNPNPNWAPLGSDNRFSDNAAFASGGLANWATGGFEWNIPQRWQVSGSGVTNSMAGCNQVFSIDTNGTAKVAKYWNWIQRTTNNVITTN